MLSERRRFARKDINVQTAYLEDLYGLISIEMEENAIDTTNGGSRSIRRSRRNPSPGEKALPGQEPAARKQPLLERIRLFEERLRAEPERFPLGALFTEARLNAFERFVVAATAATAMFDRHCSNCFDVRTLVSLHHSSHVKRLDAELYFQNGCRLIELGIIQLEQGRPWQQVFEKDVRISPPAYAAILGKQYDPEERPSGGREERQHRSRPERPIGRLYRPEMRLRNLVLAPEALDKVEEALVLAGSQSKVYEDWGLGSQVSYGRSVSMLFTGPPGTGKTLAAEAVSHELGMKMLAVRGSDIVSPWHGEDEIRAAAVFKRALEDDAVLVFDEADSFFYARHGVRHSMDEASNRTVNVFLGCLEEHELPVILTTNRADALDPALERRISLKIVFEIPAAKERARIWKLHLSRRMPLSKDVDVRTLAERYVLTGGQIKNAVVTAARRAIARERKSCDSASITMQDLELACAGELEGSQIFGTVEREIGFKAPER